jgi:diguanylate cyclase (GGDEF)-like protein
VLVVDDEPVNVHALGAALADKCEVIAAKSGERALELAASGVDLVLLDVDMPGLNGLEVCRRLKADDRTRAVPVIFVTARDEMQDEESGFEAGGVDYIAKPIRPPIVKARVQTHLALKQARDALELMASHDGLTGVANRRRFDERLDAEWKRSQRNGYALTLVLLDVDHFKAFNDTYGHGRGDDCLRQVATALAAECRRPADLVARYGGEEFALVLPETDTEGARESLERVLGRMETLAVPHAASSCAGHVTISAGALTLVPTAAGTASEVLATVDRLLYAAKAAGRRRAIHEDAVTGVRSFIHPPGDAP